MKKLLTLVVLLAAVVAYAGSYTVTTNTAQDNRLERQRVRLNKATCAMGNLPSTCTQAQIRAVNPGFSNANIYSDITDLLNRYVIKNHTDGLKRDDTADDQAQFCTWFAGATAAQRNQACALAGLPNGCEACAVP